MSRDLDYELLQQKIEVDHGLEQGTTLDRCLGMSAKTIDTTVTPLRLPRIDRRLGGHRGGDGATLSPIERATCAYIAGNISRAAWKRACKPRTAPAARAARPSTRPRSRTRRTAASRPAKTGEDGEPPGGVRVRLDIELDAVGDLAEMLGELAAEMYLDGRLDVVGGAL